MTKKVKLAKSVEKISYLHPTDGMITLAKNKRKPKRKKGSKELAGASKMVRAMNAAQLAGAEALADRSARDDKDEKDGALKNMSSNSQRAMLKAAKVFRSKMG
ncbi:hypothetical protein DRW03_19490 [Corallococcus sp. H22C18031201]|uniref:DUF6312 domain-containing protein n=1 Tax=Citreicoccus inhibens TaxID=2849499 RepID=UPI000E72194E|nr:hypothetical protein [Citreicoccus inhibens]MBU8896967.1 hypothetical protein [Citreicoccus inhibens]RJS20859.1 hypothetical protein DRW03_19490 [Corallococcus sp. H22C18031201]